MNQPKIVVGIDGSGTAHNAMLWASAEASSRRVQLLIAHAGDTVSDESGRSELPSEFGRDLLIEAQASVYEFDASCPVETMIAADNPVHLLTELSKQADLLVVGSHGLGRSASALLGSVAFRVAAHARCPVAVIPTNWHVQPSDGHRPIVVGISATTAARSPLYYAFAQARLRGVPLRAVRSWSRIDWTGDMADLLYRSSPAFECGQVEYVERVLEPIRKLYPDVEVQIAVNGGRVDDVLLTQCADADLLVLGSRFSDGHNYSRLGPTTARLLHRTPCPTVVVGHAAAHSEDFDPAAVAAVQPPIAQPAVR